MAISYAQVASGAQTSTPNETKVYVCQIGQNGKPKTKLIVEKTALGLVGDKSGEWILGECENDVISPS